MAPLFDTMASMAGKSDKTTALWAVRQLRQAGFEALFAGGCVRDMLLAQRPDDYDIATSATPKQVRRVFRRVLMVGAKFGVAMVLHRDRAGQDRMIEVATFRSDLSYSDGRRPDEVTFSSPLEDAKRRDFTINGMFYDPITEQVIDYVGGRADLKAGVVRTIGDPNRRFAEDYLRLVRAVRFAVRLGFRIHPATAGAMRSFARRITQISGERICEELTKMFSNPSAAEALHRLEEYRLLPHILPELFKPDDERYLAARQRVRRLPCQDDPLLHFGALLMDLPKDSIGHVVRRWGGANRMKKTLQWFAAHRDDWRTAADIPLCRLKRLMADEHWQWLRVLWKVREKIETNSQQQAIRIARRANAIAPEQVAPGPFVTGEDLLARGVKPGRALGRILRKLYDAQLNEELHTRKAALAAARKLILEETSR